MNNEKREEQMMNAAEAYVEEVGYTDDNDMCCTMNDFCAGWRAAVDKACEWLRNHLGAPAGMPQAKAYEDAMNELISEFCKGMEE